MKTTTALVLLMVLCLGQIAFALAEEEMGNAPLNERNYPRNLNLLPAIDDSHRVYRFWCNGNEYFYFACDAQALNAALKTFAAIKGKTHEVVLRPGPGSVSSLHHEEVPFNWNIHLLTGIAADDMKGRDKAALIWNPDPVLSVYIAEPIELTKIEIPAGVSIVSVSALAKRFREALGSSDQRVRGWGCGELAELDPFDEQSVTAVTAMLKDGDDWVRENAASALTIFGAQARPALPALRDVATSPENYPKNEELVKALRGTAQQSISAIERARENAIEKENNRQAMNAINAFCAAHSN